METEIKVPILGESVSEASVAKWMKSVGDSVAVDEPLVELETDKVTLEVNAPIAGTLIGITADEGSEVVVGALLGTLEEGIDTQGIDTSTVTTVAEPDLTTEIREDAEPLSLSPAVRKLIQENNLDPSLIRGTGKDSRILKVDVLDYLDEGDVSDATPCSVPSAAVS